jgi:hypothetical protein
MEEVGVSKKEHIQPKGIKLEKRGHKLRSGIFW